MSLIDEVDPNAGALYGLLLDLTSDTPLTPIWIPRDLCTERIQPLVDPFIAALDLLSVVDSAGALCAHRRQQHRHPSPNIWALKARRPQLRRPCNDRTMRIAQHDSSAHRNELVYKEQAAFEHFSNIM